MEQKKPFYWVLVFTVLGSILPVQDVRSWLVSRYLDNIANSPHGFYGLVAEALKTVAPFQQFMLGMSAGMILAFIIGYWDQMRARIVWLSVYIPAVWWLFGQCLRGRHRVCQGGSWLDKGEVVHKSPLPAPVKWSVSEIRWWPEPDVACQIVTGDTISIVRHDRSAPDRLLVNYEIWGKRDFRATLKKWREIDYVGLQIAYKKMKAERLKAATPSPQ